MNTDLALGRTLEAVWHLADPEPPWTDILESAGRLIASESSAFIMFDGGGALTTFQHRNMDPEGEHDYVDHFHHQDIITPIAVHLAQGAWLDTQERFSAAALSRNGYYVDFMCKYRMRQMLTFVVEQSPSAAPL